MRLYLYLKAILLALILTFAACNSDDGDSSGGSDLNIEMVHINNGTFTMGSSDALDYKADPPHQVTLTKGFYMSKYLVTQEQYLAVMGNNPSHFHGGAGREPAAGENQNRRPVENVSWYDAVEFCNKLSAEEGLESVYTITGRIPDTGYPITSAAVTADRTKNGYRLPTEAEWEYACRAGTTTAYNTGDTIDDDTGWYSGNSGNKTHEVGKKPDNAWGLYDMHGNVWEWCWDWYRDYDKPPAALTDPVGASSGSNRVDRGGCWYSRADYFRSAVRGGNRPSNQLGDLGFRLVRP
ncbi:MAG: formylglycine-generating enzyme family protein [Leptospirales bacterium]|nr:formylglycine-generating enzyme family protein [Leptospirales bacterium]